jgi:hypothetical protein
MLSSIVHLNFKLRLPNYTCFGLVFIRLSQYDQNK